MAEFTEEQKFDLRNLVARHEMLSELMWDDMMHEFAMINHLDEYDVRDFASGGL